MILADKDTPLEEKLAIVLSAYYCTGCTKVFNDVETCELRQDLDKMRFKPLKPRSKGKCRYYIKP